MYAWTSPAGKHQDGGTNSLVFTAFACVVPRCSAQPSRALRALGAPWRGRPPIARVSMARVRDEAAPETLAFDKISVLIQALEARVDWRPVPPQTPLSSSLLSFPLCPLPPSASASELPPSHLSCSTERASPLVVIRPQPSDCAWPCCPSPPCTPPLRRAHSWISLLYYSHWDALADLLSSRVLAPPPPLWTGRLPPPSITAAAEGSGDPLIVGEKEEMEGWNPVV